MVIIIIVIIIIIFRSELPSYWHSYLLGLGLWTHNQPVGPNLGTRSGIWLSPVGSCVWPLCGANNHCFIHGKMLRQYVIEAVRNVSTLFLKLASRCFPWAFHIGCICLYVLFLYQSGLLKRSLCRANRWMPFFNPFFLWVWYNDWLLLSCYLVGATRAAVDDGFVPNELQVILPIFFHFSKSINHIFRSYHWKKQCVFHAISS